MPNHNPAARYCIHGPGSYAPIDDTVDCLACQELYDAAALDPDFAEEYKDYPRPRASFGKLSDSAGYGTGQ